MSAMESKAEQRSRAQRERILAAAQQCFVAHGFHAASMANIAETADISAGLIYRYFESKSEIILAIIERQLAVARDGIGQLRGTAGLVDGILESLDAGRTDKMDPALFLEMSAEATRDPTIADAVANFDRTIRADLTQWLARSTGGDGRDAEARALMLVSLIEGLKVRQAREPTLDRELLAEGLRRLLPAIVGD